MRILVDKIPQYASDCIFSFRNNNDCENVEKCRISCDTCSLFYYRSECPFLREG